MLLKLCALLILLCLPSSSAVYFYLTHGTARCFSVELLALQAVSVHLQVPDFRFREPRVPVVGLDATITSPSQAIVLRERVDQAVGAFEFDGVAEGEHTVCFSTNTTHGWGRERMRVDVEMLIGSEVEHSEVAPSLETLDGVRDGVHKIKAKVTEIKNELIYIKGREERFRLTSESTFTRTWVGPLIQVLCCIACACFQLFAIKTFLVAKKLV
eukprot:NODE_7224_length_782_cov_56.679818_g6984_i0.p1 GENE.NODE_7224_length_782_cov_56.679818_g6984_i0~~NODE_7224_length_782_cov_56.679818_g6984_i0.p1  ORF type:complete len:213 (+),score=24.65 NODE_7224_length_782_cov_56.679818_g6984_i0:63-701(+)